MSIFLSEIALILRLKFICNANVQNKMGTLLLQYFSPPKSCQFRMMNWQHPCLREVCHNWWVRDVAFLTPLSSSVITVFVDRRIMSRFLAHCSCSACAAACLIPPMSLSSPLVFCIHWANSSLTSSISVDSCWTISSALQIKRKCELEVLVLLFEN
jgi:hypothetical protein